MGDPDGFKRTIAVLDIEASALGYRSYPIEVGLAVIEQMQPIRVWSALIRPTQMWVDGGIWSSESAQIHGVPFERLLEDGKAVEQVCDYLNAVLANTIVVTDAPEHDQSWLATLFRAAERSQMFALHDYDALAGTLTFDQQRQHVGILERDRVPHRAGDDALRLAAAYVEALTDTRPVVSRLP
ncbi:hypothetical protein [Croceibacterium ferulae]|uniref:hypothetical protein n=1 Tax=Croceibacterium ferulae TaxID=1854641 RepID=UPI000EB37D98|nr:hypothetical protein [Croceibacterium ferulae]